jgi:hypothetical protein
MRIQQQFYRSQAKKIMSGCQTVEHLLGVVRGGVWQIEWVNGTLLVLLDWETPREAYRELVADARPILWGSGRQAE